MLRFFFLTIASYGLFVLFSCSTDPEFKVALAKKKYQEAFQYGSINSRPEMYSRLKEAIQLDPLEPNYHLTLGVALFSDGKLNQAETEFLNTLKLNKDFNEAHKHLGRLYLHQREWSKAIYYLHESLKNNGVASPHEVHNWLALSYYAMDDFKNAELKWLKALQLQENPLIRLNLGFAYLDHEQFQKAMDSFQKAVDLDPKLTPAHFQLALLFLKNRNFEASKTHLQTVVQLDPTGDLANKSKEYLKRLEPEK